MSARLNPGRRELIAGAAALSAAAPTLLAQKGEPSAGTEERDASRVSTLPNGEDQNFLAVTPQRFGARGDGEADDGAALQSALAAISRSPYPGGTISFPGMEMNLGTSGFIVTGEVDLDFRRTWIRANPPARLFSYGWGTKGTKHTVARPRVTGGNIRLSGAGRTAFAFQNCDSPLMRDTSIDLLQASQIGIHVRGLDDPACPYYGVLDNVRVSGGSNPVPGDGRIGILFEPLPSPESIAPNRWIFGNLRHVASIDYGIDIRGAAGMVGSNINLENCFVAAIRFGHGVRKYTGPITSLTGSGTSGFNVRGLAGTPLAATGTLIVNTGQNAGYSLPVTSLNRATGDIILPYDLPHRLAIGDSITYTEVRAHGISFDNVTYEGSANAEDFVVFAAGASGCRVVTRYLTMPNGMAFRREIEDISNSIAARNETFFYEMELSEGDGDEWLDPSHLSSVSGGWTVPEGGAWVDSVTITASVRSPNSHSGTIEADVFVNGFSQQLKPKLTQLSPNYGVRVRKSITTGEFLRSGQTIKVLIRKTGGLRLRERVRVAVRLGFVG
ncbi:hypothetical protein [Sphingopyxis sp.]|uniref:hypothetical protein n=1 Tax=Sphingopyxis sp. TaxID=1908224 RepID=UPI003F6E594E